MIPLQTADRDDPEELFRGHGFRFPVDPDRETAVLPVDPEVEDLFQM
jgi:hypothetical protein